ncbi:hypothetical protein F5050DRAFT_1168472 [Lentinula boryana]|uniref:Uncharacterized protein n=1 Tax=Lentinula boryana TaxID=40481 RepID=A0ABQ8PYK7_9AGAR|nr:hypothetical protein F5050DRAFT_1168472 [Lentinula boryana]
MEPDTQSPCILSCTTPTTTRTTTTLQVSLILGCAKSSPEVQRKTPHCLYHVDVDEERGIMIHTHFAPHSDPWTTGAWLRLRIQNDKEEEDQDQDDINSRLARTSLVNKESPPLAVHSIDDFIYQATALLVDPTTTQCVGEPLVEYEWSLNRPTEVEGEGDEDSADDHSVSEFRIPLDCCGDVSSDKNRVMVTEGIRLALQLLSLDLLARKVG